MEYYTGWQYLLIDAANHIGLDKLSFPARIQWAETNLNNLEALTQEAEEKKRPLYIKACMAIRQAQAGQATGHMVHVDACCSGIQIMSVMSGCKTGANVTGLIDPLTPMDAYAVVTAKMAKILGNVVNIVRAIAKEAVMTVMYGSKAEPKRIFGEDTPALAAFYEATIATAPGAWEVLQDLLSSWQSYALTHEWKMPDGFDVRVKVMERQEARIEVDELDHATFTYVFYNNTGSEKGISLPANVVHSVDAFIVREMHRRCNYDRVAIHFTRCALEEAAIGHITDTRFIPENIEVNYYYEQYTRSGIISAAILPHITIGSLNKMDTAYINKLLDLSKNMLAYPPFDLVTVHDSFAAHANNVNWVRWNYKEILADIADSNLLNDLLSQINGMPCQFNKLSTNLGDVIRQSNYALT